jgi:membrane protease YdiL (CAAX protease family)
MSLRQWTHSHPIASYFILTFLISWGGAGLYVAPHIVQGRALGKMDGLMMFPIMILGPAIAGIWMSSILNGQSGVRALVKKIGKVRVGGRWYLIAILIPFVLILFTLLLLKAVVSPAYAPNLFPIGLLFGIPAGFFEEIGWTGFAFPELRKKYSFVKSGLILGGFWVLWHLPVIDFLGAASPHGNFIWEFSLAFGLAMTAMRMIISWIYTRTGSIMLAQFQHAMSTGCLVVLGPNGVTAGQETVWYAVYGGILWILVLVALSLSGKQNSSSLPSF